MSENMNEIKMEELNDVNGGAGGYGGSPKRLPDKAGRKVIRIQSGDNLGKIARANGTTVEAIMAMNPSITNPNKIMAGFYIYVPA